MGKIKVKKKIRNNLKIFKSIPKSIIDGTKNKIGNFYQDFKKDREKRKLQIEKEKRIQEKKEIQQQKKQAQKDKINRAKEEKLQILAQKKLITENEKYSFYNYFALLIGRLNIGSR